MKHHALFAARLIGLTVLCATGTVQAQGQLPNLTNQNPAARFTLTDRVWAANPGDASICLWADDKLAAINVSVDDNSASNIDWWLTQSAAYGFPVTWFVITGIVGDSNPSMHGTWALYNKVQSLGHEVQSHTINHLDTNSSTWVDIDTEYWGSQLAIETNMPGHTCDFLAYPGGANSYLNNRTNAAKYYAAARGGSGSISAANKIDYFAINTMSSYNLSTPNNWSYLPNLLTNTYANCYRGLACQLWHYINATNYVSVQPFLDFIDTNRTNLWLGRFSDIAKYGEERDTATLTTNENSSTRIALTLTDQMLDSRFNNPLTLKVRLPAAWANVQATQSGQATASRVVTYNGGNYALVQAVPDQGEISLTTSAADFTASPSSGWTPLPVTFTDMSSGVITNRFWDFGDGATSNTTATSVTHTYTTGGVYTVQLIASGPDGASTNTQVDCVRATTPVAPFANFIASPTNGLAPLPVFFTETSTGSITNRFWDFGDGTTTNTTMTSVSHTYASAGTNTVKLIVSGPAGVSTNTQTNCIKATGMVARSAGFTASPTNGSAPLTVSFSDTSTGNITNRFWSFGDGATTNTTATGITHTYTVAGTNTVQLIVSGPDGSSTNTQIAAVTVTVPAPPSASFTALPTSGTAPLAVSFTDTSTGSITNRFWSFGDGATTNTIATSIAHTYAITGTNTVQLIVSGPAGSSTNTQANLISVAAAVVPTGSLLVYDPFNDAATSTVAASNTIPTGWFSDGTTNTSLHGYVASNSLSYSGLPASQGNSFCLSTKTDDYFMNFTSPNLTNAGQTVYFSMLVRFNSGITKGLNGAIRLFDSADVYGSGVTVGLGMATNTTGTLSFSLNNRNVAWILASSKTPESYALTGTTHLIVASYTRGSVGTNGLTRLWVNPDSASFGTSTPPTATLSTNTYAIDPNWNRLQLISSGSGTWPTDWQIDEVRIGTDWASVVPSAAAAVSAPVITSALTATGTVGQAFSYTITANNNPTSFNATGLPAGLSVNTNSGAITGTPTVAGSNSVTISASNTGGTDSKTLAIVISPVPVDGNGNGIPDTWETQYGITNSNPQAMAANGINTVLEAYIAGLNPTNPASVLLISDFRPPTAASILQWQSASGRVYSVYWTTNLMNSFQPLETNVVWPQNSWTDTVHDAQAEGFYQIKVQLGQ